MKTSNEKPLMGFYPFDAIQPRPSIAYTHSVICMLQKWWRGEDKRTLREIVKGFKSSFLTRLSADTAEIYLHGVAKHGDTWRVQNWSTHYHALCRHAFKLLAQNQLTDSDSGFTHFAHILTRLEMLMLCEEGKSGVDDREHKSKPAQNPCGSVAGNYSVGVIEVPYSSPELGEKRPITWFNGGVQIYVKPRTVDELPSNDQIAHGLSGIPRWTGQYEGYYSDADHCMWVYHVVKALGGDLATQLKALTHDAHEVLYNDLSSPVKHEIKSEEYKALCDNFDRLLDERLFKGRRLAYDSELIKQADCAVAEVEAQILLRVPQRAAIEHFKDRRNADVVEKAWECKTHGLYNLDRHSTKTAYLDVLYELLGRL